MTLSIAISNLILLYPIVVSTRASALNYTDTIPKKNIGISFI